MRLARQNRLLSGRPLQLGNERTDPTSGTCLNAAGAMTSGGRQLFHVERLPVLFRVPEVILNLLVKPAFRTGVEGHRETDGHLWADARTAVKNARQSLPAHAKGPRGVRNGQVQGFQAQLPEYLTGRRSACLA